MGIRRHTAEHGRPIRGRIAVPWSRLAAILVAGCLVIDVALAESLKSMRERRLAEELLASEIGYTNAQCDTDVSASIAWNTAEDWNAPQALAEACDTALSALEAVCGEAGGKKRAARISTFTCRGDGSGPQLRGGEFAFGASKGGGGFGETKAYLDANL